jgi:aryl-alcohol dehydrogenase-like predicted oxidoreductase
MNLALGTVQFGMDYGISNSYGRVAFQEVCSILQHARECGIDTLDTAIAYGESESVLGRVGVEQWKTITKLPAVPKDCKDVTRWVNDQLLQSLNRLRVSRLYGVLLHRPSQLLERIGPALYDALQGVQSSGTTNKIGVSVYNPAELDILLNAYSFGLVQVPLNILDRRMVESGLLKYLSGSGVEVHARSAFLQGLLLTETDQRPVRFNLWRKTWEIWDGWLKMAGVTPLQACLRYFNGLPHIDRVLVGVETTSQLNQVLCAREGNLTSLPEFKNLEDERLINPANWDDLS